jgi:hypothetical protein
MLFDRQLPQGGCNYGNTTVLGNTLRPHVQPTGIALLALQQERLGRGCVARAIGYLEKKIGPQTTIASLAWALLGLAAHERFPRHAHTWLQQSTGQCPDFGNKPHLQALTVLAALGETSPLVSLAADAAALARTGSIADERSAVRQVPALSKTPDASSIRLEQASLWREP